MLFQMMMNKCNYWKIISVKHPFRWVKIHVSSFPNTFSTISIEYYSSVKLWHVKYSNWGAFFQNMMSPQIHILRKSRKTVWNEPIHTRFRTFSTKKVKTRPNFSALVLDWTQFLRWTIKITKCKSSVQSIDKKTWEIQNFDVAVT